MRIKKFQEGGAAPASDASAQTAPAGAEQGGAAAGGQDPVMQIAQLFTQGLQNQDCGALSQGATMFLQLVQQQGGGGVPQAPTTTNVYKRGGKLVKKIEKAKIKAAKDNIAEEACGGKMKK